MTALSGEEYFGNMFIEMKLLIALSPTGGPVFLYIGGEGELRPWFIHEGHMANMSKKFNALIFALEHRFYGKSHPTPNLEGHHLKFLNSHQALADLATFRFNLLLEIVYRKRLALAGVKGLFQSLLLPIC